MSNRGISSFDNRSTEKTKYQSLGKQISQSQSEELSTQLQVFQNALLSFRKQYSKELEKNPQIRSEFSEICTSFGIDPLVMSSSDVQVDQDEKYNQLAVRIIELCKLTKSINGGIVLVDDLLTLINNDSWLSADLRLQFTSDDILKALTRLKSLGDELQLLTIGHRKYIKSTAQEISADQTTILSTADLLGYVTVGLLRDNFTWKTVRCRTNLNDLVSQGVLWIDTQGKDRETKYWITSWINRNN